MPATNAVASPGVKNGPATVQGKVGGTCGEEEVPGPHMSTTTEFGSPGGLALIRPMAKEDPTTRETEITARINNQIFLVFPTSFHNWGTCRIAPLLGAFCLNCEDRPHKKKRATMRREWQNDWLDFVKDLTVPVFDSAPSFYLNWFLTAYTSARLRASSTSATIGRSVKLLILNVTGRALLSLPLSSRTTAPGSVETKPVHVRTSLNHRYVGFDDNDVKGLLRALDRIGRTEVLHKKNTNEGITDDTFLLSLSSLFGQLTQKQLRALLSAVENGYYESPKRITADDLARKQGQPRSTLEGTSAKQRARSSSRWRPT